MSVSGINIFQILSIINISLKYISIPYFSVHCTSDHRISKPNPNPNSNPNPNHSANPNPNPNPDNSPDNDCSHLLVRDAVVRNAVGRIGGHRIFQVICSFYT